MQDRRDSLPMPKLLVNNYLTGMKMETNSIDVDYEYHWPSVKILRRDEAPPVMRCPAHMHMVLWGALDEVHMRLFAATDASYFQESSRQTSIVRRLPLHFDEFTKHAFPDDINEKEQARKLPSFVTGIIRPQEYAFIPNNILVGLLFNQSAAASRSLGANAARSGDGDSTDGSTSNSEPSRHDADPPTATHILMSCFVDASNFDVFTESLELHSLVSNDERLLLNAIRSPSFPRVMNKFPVQHIFAQSNSAVGSNLRTMAAAIDDTAAAENTAAGTNKNAGAGRNRRKKAAGSNDFKDWQRDQKWGFRISTLTYLKPINIQVTAVEREAVSLQWNSVFVPALSDKTKFGFQIYYCSVGAEVVDDAMLQQQLSPRYAMWGSSHFGPPPGLQCGVRMLNRHSDGLIETVDKKVFSRDGVELPLFSHRLGGLAPNSSYLLIVALFFDDRVVSNWADVHRVTTLTLRAPGPVVPIDSNSNLISLKQVAPIDFMGPSCYLIDFFSPIGEAYIHPRCLCCSMIVCVVLYVLSILDPI
jgi:hypothetical protein